jgi:hypothetical protein
MTTTQLSLQHPKEIIDEYVRQSFHTIFLRPISPYGFAVKSNHRTRKAVSATQQSKLKSMVISRVGVERPFINYETDKFGNKSLTIIITTTLTRPK